MNDHRGHNYLNHTHSQPRTIQDLKPEDTFILLPSDGDDSGHGGFKPPQTLLTKIEPYHPGHPWHPDARYTCKTQNNEPRDWPLNYPIIQIIT